VRRHALFIDGDSGFNIHSESLGDLRPLFAARGYRTTTLDSRRADLQAALGWMIREDTPDVAVAIAGFGAEWTIDGRNYWESVGVPYVGLMIDSPVYYTWRHQITGRTTLFLYSDADHLEIADRIGGRGIARGLFSSFGFALAPTETPTRDIDLIFAQAGGDPEAIRSGWRGWGQAPRQMAEALAEATVWRSGVSLWHEALRLFPAFDQTIPHAGFVAVVGEVEQYVRRARATRIVRECVGLPLHLSGGEWGHVAGAEAHLHARVGLRDLRAKYLCSRIVLNLLPATRFVTHHRAIEGALAGAAIASDINSGITATLGPACIPIRWEEPEGALAARIEAALADPAALDTCARDGQRRTIAAHGAGLGLDGMLATIEHFVARVRGAA